MSIVLAFWKLLLPDFLYGKDMDIGNPNWTIFHMYNESSRFRDTYLNWLTVIDLASVIVYFGILIDVYFAHLNLYDVRT
jgi:hypothetical protein